MAPAPHRLTVLVPTPAHSALGSLLHYDSELPLTPGTLVRVPLGQRELLGVVWDDANEADAPPDGTVLKPIVAVLDGVPPLGPGWRRLVDFTARYYQRATGEVALAALPPALRGLDTTQLARRLKRRQRPLAPPDRPPRAEASAPGATPAQAPRAEQLTEPVAAATPQPLTPEQAAALADFESSAEPALLFGVTGSGKTEVYLQAVQRLLAREPQAQALVMVPEINLTPQLEARFRDRFAHHGPQVVVSMHSGMTGPQRLQSWLAAHLEEARIVLGTRMAVFASLPALRLIVVDEEHDPSYKQQEGARYSARDLAIYRAKLESTSETPCRVMLGSATPSLETWHHSRPAVDGGRYRRLSLSHRIGQANGLAGDLPTLRLVNMAHQPRHTVLSGPLMAAIAERIARGEQAMVFLNRRGYAPVLHCGGCGWKSDCAHCSAYRVFHKIDRTLRCHHCGFTERVPRACPVCGNPDIAPIGRGTEQIEEQLGALLADVRRPDGQPVRVARIDADTTRHKGALASQLADVHAGDVDVLVGTQMIAKGHDFRRITLVAAVNPDTALFSSDFRAPERLFSLLLQAAGRAGRDAAYLAQQGTVSEMWLQTHHKDHPLYAALRQHDYPAFADQQLTERAQAGLPPFSFQALVRADARTQQAAQAFLTAASAATDALPGAEHVTRYPAVPMTLQRVANVERAQLLLESPSRQALQRFLAAWQPVLRATRQGPEGKGVIRWAVDVDPLAI